MRDQLLVDLFGVDHNPIPDLDVGFLDRFVRTGISGLRVVKTNFNGFAGRRLDLTDVAETFVTVPITCSSPPWAEAIVGNSATARIAASAILLLSFWLLILVMMVLGMFM
jgi:hypothetical protein